jgi:hypothetical protein
MRDLTLGEAARCLGVSYNHPVLVIKGERLLLGSREPQGRKAASSPTDYPPSARTASSRAARRAGKYAVTSAAASSTTQTDNNVTGSDGLTP